MTLGVVAASSSAQATARLCNPHKRCAITTPTDTTTTTATTAAPAPPAVAGRGESVGVAIPWNRFAGSSQASIDARMNRLNDLGVKWLRTDIPAYDLEATQGATNWAQVDMVVDSAAAHGLKFLFLANTEPRWVSNGQWNHGPSTAAERNAYADFVVRAVRRYGTKIAAVEVWNEPNLAQFWGPAPSVANYGALLAQTYAAVKAVSTVPVLAGGTGWASGSDIPQDTWYANLYAGGFKTSFDAVNVHPYQDTTQCRNGNLFGFGNIGNVTAVRNTMNAHGDQAKPIWGTEWGFSDAYTTESEQTAWLKPTLDGWVDQNTSRGATGPIFRYTLDDYDSSTVEGQFGLVRVDGSLKPTYGALKEWVAGL